jgi:hypothetical protein
MEILSFSTNWNNKLECECFTTLRLRNDGKYKVGAEHAIELKGKPYGRAKVASVKHLKLHEINEWVARLDTGYSATECREILTKMYSGKDWNTTQLALVLYVRTAKPPKESAEPNLFEP